MKTMIGKNTLDKRIVAMAEQVVLAALSAPKARSTETLSYAIITEQDIALLSDKMEEIAQRDQASFFARDAENLRKSAAVVLIATDMTSRGLNCALCGFAACQEKPSGVPCTFNLVDLGIALGSAVSTAMDMKIDNRIMYSAGKAALELPFFDTPTAAVFAIPLSVSPKNIYFDRK